MSRLEVVFCSMTKPHTKLSNYYTVDSGTTVKMRHCLILQNTHFDNLKWLLATLNKLI